MAKQRMEPKTIQDSPATSSTGKRDNESQPEVEPFFSLACDTGAHERCLIGSRTTRACECACHRK